MARGYLRLMAAVISLAVSFAVAGAAGRGRVLAGNDAAPAAVTIDNFSFGPTTLKVAAGTTVKWTNKDDIPHTVVSTDGVFKSHALDTDESFSFKFDKPGTYDYFCSLHPKMTGKVVVE